MLRLIFLDSCIFVPRRLKFWTSFISHRYCCFSVSVQKWFNLPVYLCSSCLGTFCSFWFLFLIRNWSMSILPCHTICCKLRVNVYNLANPLKPIMCKGRIMQLIRSLMLFFTLKLQGMHLLSLESRETFSRVKWKDCTGSYDLAIVQGQKAKF